MHEAHQSESPTRRRQSLYGGVVRAIRLAQSDRALEDNPALGLHLGLVAELVWELYHDASLAPVLERDGSLIHVVNESGDDLELTLPGGTALLYAPVAATPEETAAGIEELCRREVFGPPKPRKRTRPLKRQILEALEMLEAHGYSVWWMGEEHRALGAADEELRNSVEGWLKSMSRRRIQNLIDSLSGKAVPQ